MEPKALGLESISDTARWVAVFRAVESERPDAHFHDPFARRLAEAKGDEVVRLMQGSRRTSFIVPVRTKVIDDLVLRAVHDDKVDTVLNLASGLDTRPYRLDLPASLKWIEVDLPGVVHYKAEKLRGETPKCHFEAIAMDLTNLAARRELFARVLESSKRALVLTEGLLMYLPENQVRVLSDDLFAQPALRYWVMDFCCPADIAWVNRKWGHVFSRAGIRMQFAPEEGPEFFEAMGWKVTRKHPFGVEARRLHRMPVSLRWNQFLGNLGLKQLRFDKRSGIVLLERATFQ